MNRWIRNIDLRRFAGLSEVLGIEVRSDRMRVCALRARGGWLNKFKTTFEVLEHFEIQLDGTEIATSKGELLRKEIEKRNLRAKHAVVGLSPSSARTITATPPGSASNISEWISENIQRLLRIPISSKDVVVGHEYLHSSGQGKSIEITIAKRKDIEDLQELASTAKLELLGISLSKREAVTALLVSDSPALAGEAEYVYFDQNVAHVTSLISGRRSKAEQVPVGEVNGIVHFGNPDKMGSARNGGTLTVAGEVPADIVSNRATMLSPFGIPTPFTAAAGLAVKGFLPELSPVNLLDCAVSVKSETQFAKNLFHRVTIATGVAIMSLLFLQMIASLVVSKWSERIDEELLSLGPSYYELKQLEQEVLDLRAATQGPTAVVARSSYSEILHDVAASAPDGLWLKKLILGGNETGPGKLSLEGYARGSDLIAAFLKNLQKNNVCTEVRLTRSGSDDARKPAVPMRLKGKGYTTFVIEGTI